MSTLLSVARIVLTALSVAIKFGVWTVARVSEILWWSSLECKIWPWLPFGIRWRRGLHYGM